MGRAAVAVFLVSVAGWSGAARAGGCPLTGKPDCGACGQLTCDPEGFWYCDSAPKDGLACDDGNLCTWGDHCSLGTCVGTAITCADTACSTQTCNGTSQCSIVPEPSSTCCTRTSGRAVGIKAMSEGSTVGTGRAAARAADREQ